LGLPSANYSLCHGLAGQAEVLRLGSRLLGEAEVDAAGLAGRVAAAGVGQYGEDATRWPCGTMSGGQTPGLMLGLAGIGHFYLRLHSPAVPSILLPRPEEFRGGRSPSAPAASAGSERQMARSRGAAAA
jgi:lantibiotic modifying enzyme